MTKYDLPFEELTGSVLLQLKEQKYMDSTLKLYQIRYGKIQKFLSETGRMNYDKNAGMEFLAQLHVKQSTFSAYKCAVRRLDDYIDGKPFRFHYDNSLPSGPDCFSAILERFLLSCQNLGNRPATVKAKKRTVGMFLDIVEINGCIDLSALTVTLVSRAILVLGNIDRLGDIRHFLQFLYDNEITQSNLSYAVPRSHKRRQIIPSSYTIEEIQKIENVIDTSTDAGRRDRAIILLITRMGLRSGDVVSLKYTDINLSDGYLNIIQEKTKFPLRLQIPKDVIAALIQHIENTKTKNDDGYIFHGLSAPYGRITTGIIRNALNKYLALAGIDIAGRKHGPHALRSSLASSMVNDGASYETVRKILGHTDPNMIKHYARIDVEKLRLCAIEPPNPTGLFQDLLEGKKVISHV